MVLLYSMRCVYIIYLIISWKNVALAQKNCSTSDYQCLDGECVSNRKQCDGLADCSDGSDETIEACKQITCTRKEFHCAYGACVSINSLCDGIKDCADNSDEVQCPMFDFSDFCTQTSENEQSATLLNPTWMVPCLSGECIPLALKCDGIQHCSDNSDEIYQTCQFNRCPIGFFRCDYGACLPENVTCNGVADCLDNSDETLGVCGSVSNIQPRNICGKDFQCASGFCIGQNLVCNGKRDCDDGSDETYQQCKNVLCDGFQCKYGGCVNLANLPRDLSQVEKRLEPFCVDSSDSALSTTNKDSEIKGPCNKESSDYCHCKIPSQPENGYVKISTNIRKNLVYPGSTIRYFCDENYNLDSEGTLLCLRNGTWNSTIPKCLQSCSQLPSYNLDISCVKNNKIISCEGPLVDGTIARVQCKGNYQVKNSVIAKRVLICKNGSWNNDLPECSFACGTSQYNRVLELKRDVSKVNYGEYPWHLGLYRKIKDSIQQICSASLISDKFVLTGITGFSGLNEKVIIVVAAHCIWDSVSDKLHSSSDFLVSAGKLYRYSNTSNERDNQLREVSYMVVPEEFKGHNTYYEADIALLVLSKPFQFDTFVSPICIDTTGNVLDGKIAGWDFSSSSSNDILAANTIKHVEKEVCFFQVPSSFIKFTIYKLCGRYGENGKPICYGNSGAGWSIQRGTYSYVQGILSVAPVEISENNSGRDKCGKENPVVFTSVYHNLKWLRLVILAYELSEKMKNTPQLGNQLSKRNCNLGPPPNNGKYKVNDRTSLKAGAKVAAFSVLEFKCEKGYTISDTAPSVCLNGQWSRPYPKCQKTCPPLRSTSVIIKCELNGAEVSCDEPMLPNTVASFRCKDAYDVQPPPIYSTSKCFDGVWDYPLYSCFPVCGIKVPEGQKFIVGGNDTAIGDFPWHVGVYQELILDTYSQICGGTIISPRLVLTAAHCFVFSRNPDNYGIAAGKYYRQWKHPMDIKAQYIKVHKIIIPDRYQAVDSSYTYDIAVVIVKNQFILSHLVRPICMDWSNQYDDYQLSKGAIGYVAGWGLTTEGGDSSEELKTIELPYIPFRECYDNSPKDFRPFIANDKFCAGHLTGHAVCEGDSGGGLAFVKDYTIYYLRGIVSVGPQKGNSCDANRYTVFTRISTHLKWIISVDNSNRFLF